MYPEFIYFLKVNIALVLFYAFYRLFFYSDTFFNLRRGMLQTFLLMAVLYPLLDISGWVKEYKPVTEAATLYVAMLPEVFVNASKTPAVQAKDLITDLLLIAYWSGVVLLGIRFLFQLGSILLMSFRCKTTWINGSKVHLLNEQAGPFSFFQLVFVHPQSHSEKELEEILTHEQTHARQLHSLDVMLGELLTIVCWFNPFVWLLKREVRQNLEYLADQTVILNGHDRKSYQYHLLGLANQKAAANLYNSFNVLPLKNRIRMMNKKRSHDIGRTKYLLFVPLAATLMLVSNMNAVASITPTDSQPRDTLMSEIVVVGYAPADQQQAANQQKKVAQPQKKAVKKGQPPIKEEKPRMLNGEEVLTVVDVMPMFPGGDHALMKFIAQTVKYPVEDQKSGTQGRVIASFTVDKKGNIVDPEVLRGVSPSLDAEALRVISLMPVWQPGKQDGKPANVRYTVPITFRLQ